MTRYAIWNKTDDIFTLGVDSNGKGQFTAQEYITRYAPWAARPDIKVIVGGGLINGTVFMEYTATIDHYKRLGVEIPDNATPEEALAAIEAWEDTPQEVVPSAEERMAAALELNNLLQL